MHILTRCYFHLGLESERQLWGPWTSIMEIESEQNSNSMGVLALGSSLPRSLKCSLYERQAAGEAQHWRLWALAWGVQRCRKIITLVSSSKLGQVRQADKGPLQVWEPLEFTTVWASRQNKISIFKGFYIIQFMLLDFTNHFSSWLFGKFLF